LLAVLLLFLLLLLLLLPDFLSFFSSSGSDCMAVHCYSIAIEVVSLALL
jgi:hypothetical protein